jgi:hypothetical protein
MKRAGVFNDIEKPFAVIDTEVVREGNTKKGVKVVRTHRDKVEFERNSRRRTQRVKRRPNLTWPEIW